MNKFYDKLLLVLTSLALAAGVFLYLKKSELATKPQSNFLLQPAENPYQPVPVPDLATREAAWPEPTHQSSGPDWLYDVFTPPKIYLDAEGNFTAEPPKPPLPPEPFGIYLAQMQRKPFRIQLQGYSGDRTKPEEAVLFLFDEERQERFTMRPGSINEASEVEVASFKIDRRVYDSSNIEVTATATILDQRSGKQVILNDNERLYEPEITVVFRSDEDSTVKIELQVDPSKPLTRFETSAGKYILQEINLEASTVTVEKEATEDTEAEILTLSPTNFEPVESTESPESEEASINSSEVESNLDFIF
ncbi:MAG: hypothetical protein ACNA77_01900 [Opitutales bacterium]